MTRASRMAVGAILALSALGVAWPASVAAQPAFGQPTVTATLGEPLQFTTTIADAGEGTVELTIGLVGREQQFIIPAQHGTEANTWEATAEIHIPFSVECSCFFDGASPPNTRIEFRFRVRAPDGTLTLGPVGEATVVDDRFAWRTIEQDLVRVHWYEGDEAFAQATADVANEAIDRAAGLLGTTLPTPVDLYVYATQEALLEAVSPDRESIAGEAHATISTMFVWLPPSDDPERHRVVVAHELTHLVFNVNTENLYSSPARWLNEGIATYLSEGYSDLDRNLVTIAAADGSLIPLQGLAGFFPSPQDQFFLAYSESVSAVDFFVRTYSEQTLWELVRSYAQGLSDDEAFIAATRGDVAAFNAAWTDSLGVEVREPVGPQPAPPGPVPSDWLGTVHPTIAPVSPGPVSQPPGTSPPRPSAAATPAPSGVASVPTPRPNQPPPTDPVDPGDATAATNAVVVGLLIGGGVLIAVVALVLAVQRSRQGRPPPPWY